jgi:hypothetical protein
LDMVLFFLETDGLSVPQILGWHRAFVQGRLAFSPCVWRITPGYATAQAMALPAGLAHMHP